MRDDSSTGRRAMSQLQAFLGVSTAAAPTAVKADL
jgi:hypothetical protein